MATNELAMTPFGAMMLVSTSAEDRVDCPHCTEAIRLQDVAAEPGTMAVACPHCDGRSLLVRLVSVLHRAVRLPGELWSQLHAGQGATSVSPAVQMPAEVFSLKVSKGAIVLLALLWKRAEQTGSRAVESSVAQLARLSLSGRPMIRRWLEELTSAGALREVRAENPKLRRWELEPKLGTEVGDAGR